MILSFRIFICDIILLVGVQGLNRVKILDYPVQDPYIYPYDVAMKNAEQFANEMKKSSENVLIFPEYSLTSLTPVNSVKNHLNDYCVQELVIGSKFCDSTTDKFNTEALKILSCSAIENKKDVVFHVVEKSGDNFYSTIVHIDNSGILKHKHRKEVTIDELEIIGSSTNNRIFKINDEEYTILMGFESIFVDFNQQWKNIIYFPNSNDTIPILYSLLPKEKDGLNIYRLPTRVDKKSNIGFNLTYSSVNEIVEDCKIEYKATDETSVKTNYKIATYSGPIKFGNFSKDVKICGLISTTGATTDFDSIKIISSQDNFIVGGAKFVANNREPIESLKTKESKTTMATNIPNLQAYGIVQNGGEMAKFNYLFVITILLTLWLS